MPAILTTPQLNANAILSNTTGLGNNLIQQYQNIYNAIWNPPANNNGITTVSLISALGTNAASVLAFLTAMPALITAGGGTVPTVTGAQQYTANSDGTVTLN